jgi:hypothetical protein
MVCKFLSVQEARPLFLGACFKVLIEADPTRAKISNGTDKDSLRAGWRSGLLSTLGMAGRVGVVGELGAGCI